MLNFTPDTVKALDALAQEVGLEQFKQAQPESPLSGWQHVTTWDVLCYGIALCKYRALCDMPQLVHLDELNAILLRVELNYTFAEALDRGIVEFTGLADDGVPLYTMVVTATTDGTS